MTRPSDKFALFVLAALTLLVLGGLSGSWNQAEEFARRDRVRRVVAEVGLTDLVLATESRHTRHPSQADPHAAFQSHPLALDHFPSGTFIPPPRFARTNP